MIKNYSSTHIASIRVLLGITQQQLANSLGVSRSLVAMAETNKRALPSAALPLLKGMNQIAATIPEPVNTRRTAYRYNRVRHSTRTESLRGARVAASTLATKWQPAMTSYNKPLQEQNNYSIGLLKTKGDCEQLLNSLLIQKAGRHHELQFLQLERETAAAKGTELSAQLLVVNALLEAGQRLVSTYPQSPAIKKWELRNAKYHYKKLLLEHKMENFTEASLLQRELRINITEKRLLETDRVIDAVSRQMEMVE